MSSYKYRLSRNDAIENGQHIEKAAGTTPTALIFNF